MCKDWQPSKNLSTGPTHTDLVLRREAGVQTTVPWDGLYLAALTAPSPQPSLPAALFLGRHLLLGCGWAAILRCSPMFLGMSLSGSLPGSTVPLDGALSGLAGPLMGVCLFNSLLGGGHAILL